MHEEESKKYGYVSGYKPRSVKRQITQLLKLFPMLSGANQELLKKIRKDSRHQLPGKAEGWFVVPDWHAIAETYEEAVHIVVDLFKKQRKTRFHSFEKYFSPTYLREREEKIQVMEKLKSEQKADILLFPAQLGLQYAGKDSPYSNLPEDEFGFGFFELAIIIMTHPKRSWAYYDLHVYAVGDDFGADPEAYGDDLGFRCDGGGLNISESSREYEGNYQTSYATGFKVK